LGLRTEISNTDMETMRFNNYKEISRNKRDINGILAIMCERTRFSCKDEQIGPVNQ